MLSALTAEGLIKMLIWATVNMSLLTFTDRGPCSGVYSTTHETTRRTPISASNCPLAIRIFTVVTDVNPRN